jgi:uncharacterized protein (TIGR03083 family)
MVGVEELVDRWRDFISSAVAELKAVRSDAWQRPSIYPGWTAHDLLAHLSSTVQAIPRLVDAAFSEPRPEPAEPFDEDRWNAGQVRRRRDLAANDLIDEFQRGGAELSRALNERVLRRIDLQRVVPIGAGRGNSLGDVLEEQLDHQRRHLADLLESVAP